MMKNKKFIVVCSNNIKIPIDDDELMKVYEAVSAGDVKILRRGWFNPSFFVGIQEDDDYMDRFREDRKYDIRDGKIDAYPLYKDLFPELREQIKALADGTNPNTKKLHD